MVLDVDFLGVSRDRIYEALVAEGIEGLAPGYTNLHLLPMYQQKIAYGSQGFPWTSDICHRDVDYSQGICPVAEELQTNQYLGYEMCLSDLSDDDVDLIVQSFIKVWEQMELLR
jgi:dTDP-4-amino-4,6-dideoxygalactose transaminase